MYAIYGDRTVYGHTRNHGRIVLVHSSWEKSRAMYVHRQRFSEMRTPGFAVRQLKLGERLRRQGETARAKDRYFRLACLPHSDVVLSGLVHVVDLHHNGEDGVRARRRFVHRGRPNRAHLLTLVHETIDALLVADDRLSQALHHRKDTVKMTVTQPSDMYLRLSS